ncbi:MAG: hypothetical protein RIT45_1850 [Pseudomonadota bacterium]
MRATAARGGADTGGGAGRAPPTAIVGTASSTSVVARGVNAGALAGFGATGTADELGAARGGRGAIGTWPLLLARGAATGASELGRAVEGGRGGGGAFGGGGGGGGGAFGGGGGAFGGGGTGGGDTVEGERPAAGNAAPQPRQKR